MPVDIIQWRATIGCFRVIMPKFSKISKNFSLFSLISQILKLYCICSCFVAITVLAFPITFIFQFLAVHSTISQLCFVSLFPRVHRIVRIIFHVTIELLKHVPVIVRNKCFHFRHACILIACIGLIGFVLISRWLVPSVLLLSGDIEVNPGPQTLDFCCWNLNSIAAHDFLRVSLIEAYNSVYSYEIE